MVAHAHARKSERPELVDAPTLVQAWAVCAWVPTHATFVRESRGGDPRYVVAQWLDPFTFAQRREYVGDEATRERIETAHRLVLLHVQARGVVIPRRCDRRNADWTMGRESLKRLGLRRRFTEPR